VIVAIGSWDSPVSRPGDALAATATDWHASHGRYQVFLFAPVQGGSVGWCFASTTANGGQFGCTLAPMPGYPILDESCGGSSPPPVKTCPVLTTGEVAAVSVRGGIPIPTRSEPGLPYGFRAVLLELNGIEERGLPKLTAFGVNGETIPSPTQLPERLRAGYELGTRGWQRPARPKRGACQITSTGVPGLTAQWGRTIQHIRSFTGIIGRPFLSCVDTEYYLENWPLDVGVVLDATQPGTAPAPLPLMKPLHGHLGYFQAPGGNGKVLGRRIHGAWLLVEGGSDLRQRLTVLEHARATIQW
jgi:hypothetical protein